MFIFIAALGIIVACLAKVLKKILFFLHSFKSYWKNVLDKCPGKLREIPKTLGIT